jgi:dienelactone hydrolase
VRARSVLLLLLLAPAPLRADPEEIEGLKVWLLVPPAEKQPFSLVIILHGYGGTADGMAAALATYEDDGYVVCAPKSRGEGWTPADVEAVKRIAATLLRRHPIDPDRVHVVGFSNGGWNLAPLAFDERLRPRSATWIAAGFQGGSVPKWAAKRLGALALAGEKDPNAAAARDTVRLLRGKVRSVEVRLQPGLDHKWPHDHDAYLRWWMGVQEGRFTPGDDRNFAWTDALDAGEGAGALVYVYDPAADAGGEEARRLQNEVFMDPQVRFFGAQLRCVKLARAEHAETAAKLGVTATPAVAVLRPDGSVAKLFQGKVKASALAAALRQQAKVKRMPEEG